MYEDVSAVTKVSRSMQVLCARAYLLRKLGMEDQSCALSFSFSHPLANAQPDDSSDGIGRL